jgi:hypothetical protein
MVKNRQKGITKAYRNVKKDVDTRGVGFFARRDFLLASNLKKKRHIAQPPKMATIKRPTPCPILLISPPKIML